MLPFKTDSRASSQMSSGRSVDVSPDQPEHVQLAGIRLRRIVRTTSEKRHIYDDGTVTTQICATNFGDRENIAPEGTEVIEEPLKRSSHAPTGVVENATPVEELHDKTEKLREELRDLQASNSKQFQYRLKEGAKEFVPKHLFEKDPRIQKKDQHDGAATLLDREIARAKASAELNIYLAYCPSVQKKLDFLAFYKQLEDETVKGDVKEKMKELAAMHLKYDEHGNKEVHKTKNQKFPHPKQDQPKSTVHQLGRMPPKKKGFASDHAETTETVKPTEGAEPSELAEPSHTIPA